MTVALPAEEIAAWGWRIPFLLALPLLAVSLYLRWSITETPVFEEVVAENRRDRIPFFAMFRSRPGAIAIAIGAALLGIGSYSLMNTYTMNYGVAQLGFSFQDLLIATTIGGLLQLVTIPLFGAMGDAHRLRPGRGVGRARHAAHRVPDVLPAAVRDIPDPRRRR